MDHFQPEWFTETGVLNSHSINLSVKVDKIVHQEKSKYQNVLVFDR
jgi:spermidine synthase